MMSNTYAGGEKVVFDLVAGATGALFRGAGWSKPEPIGTWSDGPKATLEIRTLEPGGSYSCRLTGHPYIALPELSESLTQKQLRRLGGS